MADGTPVLQTKALTKRWGGFVANDQIDLSVHEGERHALIGPNGAGKTTFVNLLTGVEAPTTGAVMLRGRDVSALSPDQRVKHGLARTFQINSLFPRLTVLESVVLARLEAEGLTAHCWKPVAAYRRQADEASELLDQLGLSAEGARRTETLAYGRQRLVEIALALASRPSVLLLDEPAAGIPQAESQALFEVLKRLPRTVSVLFIEHDMDLVFRFAERITVLVAGRVLVQGTPDEIASDARVKEVYLGSSHGD